MEENVPFLLSIKKAASYFGIGQHALRTLVLKDTTNAFHLRVGRMYMIKRDKFEEYLNNAVSLPLKETDATKKEG